MEAVQTFDLAVNASPQDQFWHLSIGGISMKRSMGSTIAGKINSKLLRGMSQRSGLNNTWRTLSEIYAPVPEKGNISDSWLKKGYELGRYRFYEDALRCFNAAIELNSQDPLAWKGKGLALEASGRSSEADAAFAKARALGLMA
jgi:tetratricopeptide (TPR) repeat protein